MPALHSPFFQMPKSCPNAKIKIFINQFFLFPSIINLSNIKISSNYFFNYYTEMITIYKICLIILKFISKKTLGKNGIFNLILKLVID